MQVWRKGLRRRLQAQSTGGDWRPGAQVRWSSGDAAGRGPRSTMANRWSRRVHGRLCGRGDFGLQSNDIVNYWSISVAALVRIRDELVRGELSANVEVCTLVHPADELEAGATVRVVKKCRGQAKVRVPYDKRFFSVPEAVLQDKPRELWTTTDVCEFHVNEETNINQALYFELLEPGEVGKPFQGAFVSQARKCHFGDLVDGLVDHFRNRKGVQDLNQAFVWLDIFCANQLKLNHPDADSSEKVRQQRNELLTHGLHAAIERFDERLVFFNSWDRPEVMRRLWCVWELYGAIKSGKAIEIVFSPGEDKRLAELLDSSEGPDEIVKAVSALDPANAECHCDKDRDMIVGHVKTLPGGFGDINCAVLDQLRSWLCESATELARTRGVNRIKFNVGRLLQDMGEMEAALAQFEEVLALYKEQLEETHPSVLNTRNAIAQVIQSKGDYDAALEQFEEVLALRKQQLGKNHPQVAISQWQVADVLVDLGQLEQGLGLADSALGTFESGEIAPLRKVQALTTKGRALFGLGRSPEAHECLKDAARAALGLGKQHPALAAVWHAWGVGPPRDDNKLRAALGLRKARLGHEHPLTRRSRAALTAADWSN